MKIYNYLLFRLYTQLSKNKSYSDNGILFLTTVIATVFIWITFFTLWAIVDVCFLPIDRGFNLSKFHVGSCFILFSWLNYSFFIKKKKFLEYGFEEKRRGGYLIIVYVVFVFVIFVVFANKNRERLRNMNEMVKMK